MCIHTDTAAYHSIFAKMLERILPEVQKTPLKDRKTVLVGLAVLLTKSQSMLQQPSVNAW